MVSAVDSAAVPAITIFPGAAASRAVFPDALNLLPAQQHRFARRAVQNVSRNARLVVAPDILAQPRNRHAAIGGKRRGHRRVNALQVQIHLLRSVNASVLNVHFRGYRLFRTGLFGRSSDP